MLLPLAIVAAVTVSIATITILAYRRAVQREAGIAAAFIDLAVIFNGGADPIEVKARYVGERDSANLVHGELAGAVALAASALRSVWSHGAVVDALRGIYIVVMSVQSWDDGAGYLVGGQFDGEVIRVDRALTSLAHEFAHACERRHDSQADDTHELWEARGIKKADETYRAALASARR